MGTSHTLYMLVETMLTGPLIILRTEYKLIFIVTGHILKHFH